jgi:hypothetical protein
VFDLVRASLGSLLHRVEQKEHPEQRGGERFLHGAALPVAVSAGSLPQGCAWYDSELPQFNNDTDRLPFDQHELAAMVAPRAPFIVGNPDEPRLGSEASYVSAQAVRTVYEGLGVPDRFGISQISGRSHCSTIPSETQQQLAAFVEKFLLGDESANTSDVMATPYSAAPGLRS